jgi:hypothetical protein
LSAEDHLDLLAASRITDEFGDETDRLGMLPDGQALGNRSQLSNRKLKMRLIIALLLSVFCSGRLNAEEITFYHMDTDRWWSVTGGAETGTGQATCYGQASKKDGSFVQIHRSLVDGEVWAFVHNTAWEFNTHDGGALRWNFFSAKDALIDGANFDYVVKDKNTILILKIMPKRFSEVVWNSRYFTLAMPGNVPNLSLSFESKGGSMLTSLAECVKTNEKRYKDFKPSLEKVPDAVKEQL